MDSVSPTCKKDKQAEDSDEPRASDNNLLCQTGITKEIPKPVSIPIASLDLHDREIAATDKLVQANNAGDGEINVEIVDTNPELKLNLPYREDQWLPFNKDDTRVYDRDFLLGLRKAPKSNEKPENLIPNVMTNDNGVASMKCVKLQETQNKWGLAIIAEEIKFEDKNCVSVTPGRDINASANEKFNSNVGNDGGWSTSASCSSYTPSKNKTPMMGEPLRSNQMFENWGRSTNIKTQPPLTKTAEMYVPIIDHQDYKFYHTTHALEPSPEKENLNQLKYWLRRIIRNYLFDFCTIEECDEYIHSSISSSDIPQLVSVCSAYSFLKISKRIRFKIGFLLAHLIKLGTLSLTDYCIGIKDVLDYANKLKNPIVWSHVAELMFSVLCEDPEALEHVEKVFELLISSEYSSQLLVSLLMLIIDEKEETFVFTDYSPVTKSVPSLVDSENLENQPKSILKEYLNGHCNIQECEQYIKESMSPSALSELVSDWHMSVLEKSKTDRMQTGFLFAQLMKGETLSLQSFCIGLTTVIEKANQLIFDIPTIWDDIAELVYPVLCESAKTPEHLHQLFDLFVKNHAIKLLSCLFKCAFKRRAPIPEESV